MSAETSLVLTSEQRAIIDHPLEPVRVSAGAGTGKTTTIVLRLAALIEQGVEPEAALGITFTNKAAEELADRLRQELPDLAAEGRDVEVTTYHGFAYGLLQEFGALVGMERGADVIGPGFQRQLIEEGLVEGRYRALDLTWTSGRVAEAATLTRQLGDNLLTTADLAAAAPGSPDEVWERRLELASVADAYAEAKHRVGVVDYADLVRLAHRLVTEHPELAERIRGRYRAVLLDEYQDTDPAQRLLIAAIFGDGFPLTAVGDADQTIYEWRGASLQNFEGFPAHFPTSEGAAAATLPLTENRRSDRVILDLANRIRTEIHGPAGFEPLVPVADAELGTIEVAWLRTEADEADWIANRVLQAREDGTPWSEIAALFRKNKHIGPVRDALLDAGVPVQVVSLGGLLDVPEVAELHAWLRILHDPEDSAALARILIGSSFRLGLGDLAPLARWTKAQRRRTDRDDGLRLALIEAIDRLDEVTGITPAATERLRRFHAVYSDLLVTAQGVSLVELSRQILSAIEAWTEIDAMEDHAALSARLNLYRFLDLTESWSPLEGRPSLGAFLGYLELLRDEATVDELDTAGISTEEAVSLLTVHRAKGLEWDVVVLPAVTRGTFPSRSLGYDNPLDDPKYLPYELRIDADTLPDLSGTEKRKDRNEILSEYHQAGEWRVAYVAVTRARHTLIATGSFWSDGKTPRKPSELWDMAGELADTETVIDDPGEAPEPVADVRSTPAPDPLFGDGGWPTALRAAADGPGWMETHGDLATSAAEAAAQLRLELEALPRPPEPLPDPAPATSVTGLVTLARCPLRFKWAVIDRLPIQPSTARRRGIEFHRNVELHNLGKVPLTDLDVDLYDLTEEPAGKAPAGDPFAVFLDSRLSQEKPRFAEVPVDLRIGEVRVRGRIDAVYEPEPGVWEIVDYKSGRLSDDEALDVQLHAYALAAADGAIAADRPERLTVTFAFFGGDEYVERSYEVDEAWLATARDRVEGLVALIVTEDYEPTASEECHRCDFLAFCAAGQEYVAETQVAGPKTQDRD
jgi:DNA helicase-2/ATP-dependent DNA helicase PcrA